MDMYSLIALDIDGTLIGPDGRVSSANRRAVARAREAGVRVVLCTGRSWQESEDVADQAGCDRVLVCQGGAALADLDQRRNTRRWDIHRETGRALVERLEREELGLMLFAGEELLVNPRGEEIFRTYPSAGFHRCKRVEARPGAVLEREGLPLSKIYAQGAPETFPSLLKELGRCREVELTSSAPYNFEIVPAGVDKGTSLAALAGVLGLGLEDCAAIGDSDNDRGMLAAVGMPIAMGNAAEEIRALARRVTASNREDGVAKAIGRLLEEG